MVMSPWQNLNMPLFAEVTCPLKREKRSRQTLPVSHGDEMSVALVTSDHSCHWSPAGFILCVNTSLSADVSPQTQSPNITCPRDTFTQQITERAQQPRGGRSQSSEDSWFWTGLCPCERQQGSDVKENSSPWWTFADITSGPWDASIRLIDHQIYWSLCHFSAHFLVYFMGPANLHQTHWFKTQNHQHVKHEAQEMLQTGRQLPV